VVGLCEYMQRWADGEHTDGSRLFVYKVTRKLMNLQGDTGASIRDAMKAIAAFGIPPEEFWPYDVSKYEEEPTPFLYSFAQSYKALNYVRLDPPGCGPDKIIDNLEEAISTGLAVAFGFSVYSSIGSDGHIPVPSERDRMDGGHAVLAVGYIPDYQPKVSGAVSGEAGKGGLLIRNSWGTDWGNRGYGVLPYYYIRNGLAQDFWTSMKVDWLETRRKTLDAAKDTA